MKNYKEVILSNGTDTVVLIEFPNAKGLLNLLIVNNGRKRESCMTLDEALDGYTFSNMKIVDQMTYSA